MDEESFITLLAKYIYGVVSCEGIDFSEETDFTEEERAIFDLASEKAKRMFERLEKRDIEFFKAKNKELK